MSLPGLLVEYLVVGSMALLWLLPLVGVDLTVGIPFGSAAALAPAIYVLGMFIDFIAYVLLSLFPMQRYSLKTYARWIAHRKLDIRASRGSALNPIPGRNTRSRIWLQMNAPAVFKEINERSSRDRVARGALVNILVTWLVSIVQSPQLFVGVSNLQWLGLTLAFLLLWMFFEANSYTFEIRAIDMVPNEER